MPLRIADVSADAILLAGGARAILLQIANPGVGRGVAEHSDFAARPLDRLHGTLTYLYVIVYGTPDEVARVARRVGTAHRPVEGSEYSARNEDLQLWVAATLYDTAMLVRERVFGPLDPADAEALLDDYAIIATTLGLPRSMWPADRASFDAYWARSVAALRVDAPARRVAQELLHPAAGPLWLRALMPMVRVLTAGLLEPQLRAAYDLPLRPRRFALIMTLVRVVYPRLPEFIRHAPKRQYLRRFRADTPQPGQ